ncbi:hypothetical protein [Paraburkholderia sp. 40]|uniref:hypothetical protein n=1 Tax=Paraburkholderia sp. 40 TaxID=2991059 RepID=UPI003D19694D
MDMKVWAGALEAIGLLLGLMAVGGFCFLLDVLIVYRSERQMAWKEAGNAIRLAQHTSDIALTRAKEQK